MSQLLPVHIIAGLTGIVSGSAALYAVKGARRHRKSGMLFVYAMSVLAVSGAVIAAQKVQRLNALQGLFTLYLVVTALLTVKRPQRHARWIDLGAFLFALTLCFAYAGFGLAASNAPTGKLDGYPPGIFFVFGGVAVLATLGDVRMLLAPGLTAPRRLARHLWRMCFAMFIAPGSFFLGQAKFFPEPIRIFPLLALPVVATLVVMVYWLWRVRIRRNLQGLRFARGGSDS